MGARATSGASNSVPRRGPAFPTLPPEERPAQGQVKGGWPGDPAGITGLPSGVPGGLRRGIPIRRPLGRHTIHGRSFHPSKPLAVGARGGTPESGSMAGWMAEDVVAMTVLDWQVGGRLGIARQGRGLATRIPLSPKERQRRCGKVAVRRMRHARRHFVHGIRRTRPLGRR
jgi:hypothetical protein